MFLLPKFLKVTDVIKQNNTGTWVADVFNHDSFPRAPSDSLLLLSLPCSHRTRRLQTVY